MNKGEKMAYFAGIIDGEGCVNISRISIKSRWRYMARFNVVSTDEVLVDWLQANFKGFKYRRDSHLKKHPHWKVKWEWHLCLNKKSLPLLKKVEGFLVIKSPAVVILRRFLDTIQTSNKRLTKETQDLRELLYNELKKFNNRKPAAETK